MITVMATGSEDRSSFVNGAQLPNFVGKKVNIIGLVSNVNPGGISFTLKSTDNINVPITLKKPITDAVNGYVQVMGISQSKSIAAEEFVNFNNETFDAKNYNLLCQLLNSHPNLLSIK